MKVGKLYKCPEYYLMIYPSAEKASVTALEAVAAPVAAAGVAAVAATPVAAAVQWAAVWWSNILNCKVRFSEPGEVFMCLKQQGKHVYVLFGEKKVGLLQKTD